MDDRTDYDAEILRFIRKFTRENRGDGPQYTKMTKYFEKDGLGWRHGTFSKYLKELKAASIVETRLDVKIGRPRYYISKEKADQAEDIVFKDDVGRSCTNRIQISKEVVIQALLNYQERMDKKALDRAGLLAQIKLKKSKEFRFFNRVNLEEGAQKMYPGLSITIACPPGTKPPEIPEWGYRSMLEVLLGVTELDDVASRFQIILTRDLTVRGLDFPQFEPSVFLRWLKEIKGIEVNEEIRNILPYVFAEKEWESTTNDEVNHALLLKLMNLCIEFRGEYTAFFNTYNRGARRFFKDKQIPYEEYLERYKRKHHSEKNS